MREGHAGIYAATKKKMKPCIYEELRNKLYISGHV
jgi:hypothetical protein